MTSEEIIPLMPYELLAEVAREQTFESLAVAGLFYLFDQGKHFFGYCG